jgi:3-dehydroquinate synthase
MPSAPDTLQVSLPMHSYPIFIGSRSASLLAKELRARCSARRATIITDAHVGPTYADTLVTALQCEGFAASLLTIPAGESSKSLCMAAELYDALAELQHRRDEPIIALGGGVIGDLAGFVAATWHRGVPFVQCPTTVEADIDAAIGGKTGVNHPAGKNLIGAFHQPLLVSIDLDYLDSLPTRDFVAGLAESVKHGISLDTQFLEWHEANVAAILRRDREALQLLIHRNCQIKASVVTQDEREAGRSADVGRAALNFGHTVGHALEAQSQYALRHGEAVSLGIIAALDIAVRRLGLPNGERQRCEELLGSLGLPTRLESPVDADVLLERMAADKKNLSPGSRSKGPQGIRFVLTPELGQLEWFMPQVADIRAALDYLGK